MTNLEIREGEYGDKILAVEPGGIESIPTKGTKSLRHLD
jgi:hypothetical protein